MAKRYVRIRKGIAKRIAEWMKARMNHKGNDPVWVDVNEILSSMTYEQFLEIKSKYNIILYDPKGKKESQAGFKFNE